MLLRVIFALCFSFATSQDRDQPCILENSTVSGICKPREQCEYVRNLVNVNQQKPQTCSYEYHDTFSTKIVCCPQANTHETGDFRNLFFGLRHGELISTGGVCYYEGYMPMICCSTPNDQPANTDPCNGEREPTFNSSHLAWQKYLEYQRQAGVCRKSDCGFQKYSDRINAGNPVALKEMPHMALIGCANQDQSDVSVDIKWVGGGSLISDRFVLTAAHVLNHNLHRYVRYVLLGIVDKKESRNGDLYTIIKRIPQKNYVQGKGNDIALLKLDRRVKFSKFVIPLSLPVPGHFDVSYRLAAGWGLTSHSGKVSDTLQKIEIKTLDVNECTTQLSNKFNPNDPTTLCARGIQNTDAVFPDTCEGDSGGPIMMVVMNAFCAYVVEAVVSWGPKCGLGSPGVYTRVAPYLEDIVDVVWRGKEVF